MIFAVLASIAFFVTLSFGLLLRYRQISRRINASTDLGRDLWDALEQRLKKQDSRILDIMSRFEVIQSRYLEQPVSTSSQLMRKETPVEEGRAVVKEMSETRARGASQTALDETEISVIKLLSVKPRSSVEIKSLIGRSREHAARLMKTLFDSGFVTRDDSKKPFVYQLTEMGRRYLSAA